MRGGGDQSVALLLRSLDYGGAEMQATVLANGLARAGFSVTLLVFYSGGPLRERLSSEVTVRCLGKRGRWDVIGFLCGLLRVLGEERPAVLYAFLPVANLLACLAKLRSRELRVVWGIRASNMDLTRYDWLSRLTYWLERRFSRCPNLIIANSAAGRRHAVSRGFPDDDRFVVIPNGIDVERFRPDSALRAALRAEWGVSSGESLVGIVARLDPMKDHPNFLDAAARLARRDQRVRFVCVGDGPESYKTELHRLASELGLDGRLVWAGARHDMSAVYNALDITSSSSYGEGFSNAIAEAMACGVPCVATGVGDAREILGDCGVVVPPGDSESLAAGIAALLERMRTEGASLGARARGRIVEHFSVETLVRRTREALEAMP